MNKTQWKILMVVGGFIFLTIFAVTLWPIFHSDNFSGKFYHETRSFMWPAIFYSLITPFIVVLFLGFMPLMTLSHLADKFNWGKVHDTAEKMAVRCATVILPIMMGIGFLAVIICAALRFMSAPSTSTAAVLHLGMVDMKTLPSLRNLGPYTLNNPNAHVEGDFVSIGDNVLLLTIFPPMKIFSGSVSPISDIHLRQDALLVVMGNDLIQVTKDDEVDPLAKLPLPNMKIGLIAAPGGTATEILPYGNDGGHGYVFMLKGDKTYSKLLDVDENIVGVVGCLDYTAVAFTNRVLLFRPGFKPRLLLQLPEGSAPITSILGRVSKNIDTDLYPGSNQDYDDDCLWLVATRNCVYAHQSGMTTLLIAGLGGNLSSDENAGFDFILTDPERNTAVSVSFQNTETNSVSAQ